MLKRVELVPNCPPEKYFVLCKFHLCKFEIAQYKSSLYVYTF